MIAGLRNRTNRWAARAIVAIVVAIGFSALHNASPVAAESARTVVNTITVTGKGEVSIAPDVAYVQFGLVTEGKTAREAQQKNSALFSKIQAEIKKQGVADADIRTARYDTYPNYRWENNENMLTGYRSEHIVEVTYRQIDAIGALIDSVSEAGANRIENVRFGTEKMDEYERLALQNALDNARNKAETLAQRLGKNIKGVVAIQELGATTPPIIYREELAAKAGGAAADSSTTIHQGQLTISAHLHATYEF